MYLQGRVLKHCWMFTQKMVLGHLLIFEGVIKVKKKLVNYALLDLVKFKKIVLLDIAGL